MKRFNSILHYLVLFQHYLNIGVAYQTIKQHKLHRNLLSGQRFANKQQLELVDPLGLDSDPDNRNQINIISKTDINYDMEVPNVQRRLEIVPQIPASLAELEREMLGGLPTLVLVTFNDYLNQIIYQSSFVIILIHLMLLLPILRYLKLEMGVSIFPFFYLGPVLLTLPAVAASLWRNNIVSIPLIDDKLQRFITAEKIKAQEMMKEMSEDEGKLSGRALKELAFCRVIDRVDEASLADEVKYLLREGVPRKPLDLWSGSRLVGSAARSDEDKEQLRRLQEQLSPASERAFIDRVLDQL